MIEITINPGAKIINVPSGTLLLDVLKQAKISIVTTCGGQGSCGKCRVKVSSTAIKGSLLNLTEKKQLSEEEIKEGFRLACQCHLYHNSTITIPSSVLMRNNNSKIEEKSISHLSHYEFKPVIPIKKYFLRLNPPTLKNQSSDWTRIKDELNRVAKIKKERWFIAPDILGNVSQLLRDNNYGMTIVLYKNEVISVEPGNTSKEMYGVAFDIGTTTIAGYLIDFSTGKQIVAEAGSNPQYIYGDDVISRVGFAGKNATNRNIIQQELISFLNQIITSLSRKTGINLSRIYFAVLVGNTAMHHFLWSLPTENLAFSPYIPVLTEGFFKEARDLPDLCLIPHAKVYSTPNVSAYIGGDIIADLIDINIWGKNNNILMVDLGTNGEIVLKGDDKIWACSAAAGPAFEGARISSGMRAIRGAIDRIIITEHKIRYQVIEQTRAAGLCGSGIIDLIASLLKLQLIKSDG
ncbi:MAG TPA: ASKHA domain-containing protein, partial [Atribacterota bacterium]|nr:ASKHA domain-containing protein [Atribacterota bacterium]